MTCVGNPADRSYTDATMGFVDQCCFDLFGSSIIRQESKTNSLMLIHSHTVRYLAPNKVYGDLARDVAQSRNHLLRQATATTIASLLSGISGLKRVVVEITTYSFVKS